MILLSTSSQLRKKVKALKTMELEEIKLEVENSTSLYPKEKAALISSFNYHYDRKNPLANWN